jgi:hypothetical protein
MVAVHTARQDCDILAANLSNIVRIIRGLPPSWDGSKSSFPVCTPEGVLIGRALPGRGLALPFDLKEVGIHGMLPGVYERTSVNKLIDVFRETKFNEAESYSRAAHRRRHRGPVPFVHDPERGAISGTDAIILARTSGKAQRVTITKTMTAPTAINAWTSLWRAAGNPTAGVYTNTPGTAPSRTNQAAWSLGMWNPTAPDKKYLLSCPFMCSQIMNSLFVVDLLLEIGNLSVATTGAKTVNSVALTRHTNGADVWALLVVTTALGTGTGAYTITYTDQAGNTAQTSQTFNSAASTPVDRTLPNSAPYIGSYIPLADGDTGLRAVANLNVNTAHTAGVVAMEISTPMLLIASGVANALSDLPAADKILGMTELETTAGGELGCLHAYVLAGATSLGTFQAYPNTVAG